jgi:ribonuclease P protein component
MGRRSPDQFLFLRRSAEIERVKRIGRRFQTPFFNLVSCAAARDEEPCRIGIVIGKRLGLAVTRNRTKRRFRELSRQTRTQLVPGRQVIVFPKRESLCASFRQLRDTWLAALRHEGLAVGQANVSCGNSACQ